MAVAGAVVVAGDVKYGCPGVESVLYNLQHASRRCKNNKSKKSSDKKNRKRIARRARKRGRNRVKECKRKQEQQHAKLAPAALTTTTATATITRRRTTTRRTTTSIAIYCLMHLRKFMQIPKNTYFTSLWQQTTTQQGQTGIPA